MFNEAHDFHRAGVDAARPVALRGQAFPLPPRESMGAALPEATSADVDSGHAQSRNCAVVREHRYPYIGLGTPLMPTCDLWDFYADEAAKHGYQAGPENFGYMIATAVAETEEKAQAIPKASCMAVVRMPFPRRSTRYRRATLQGRIRILAKQQTSAWLGISGEKVRQQMQGGDDGAIDYAEIRRKLHAALLRGQQNMQVIVALPSQSFRRSRPSCAYCVLAFSLY